jgi:hypothetical protein
MLIYIQHAAQDHHHHGGSSSYAYTSDLRILTAKQFTA